MFSEGGEFRGGVGGNESKARQQVEATSATTTHVGIHSIVQYELNVGEISLRPIFLQVGQRYSENIFTLDKHTHEEISAPANKYDTYM